MVAAATAPMARKSADVEGLYNSTLRLMADGQGRRGLRRNHHNTNAKIVKGFLPSIMPQNFREKLSDDQINDILEYIKSLK
jgi:hypothetical protein